VCCEQRPTHPPSSHNKPGSDQLAALHPPGHCLQTQCRPVTRCGRRGVLWARLKLVEPGVLHTAAANAKKHRKRAHLVEESALDLALR